MLSECRDKLAGKPRAVKAGGSLANDDASAQEWERDIPVGSLVRSLDALDDDWNLNAGEMDEWVGDDSDEDGRRCDALEQEEWQAPKKIVNMSVGVDNDKGISGPKKFGE